MKFIFLHTAQLKNGRKREEQVEKKKIWSKLKQRIEELYYPCKIT